MATDINTVTVLDNTTTSIGDPYWWTVTTPNIWYSSPTYIYKYQIQCPKKTCRKFNWLELNIVAPCVGCGSKLKAVLDEADYEIAVNK